MWRDIANEVFETKKKAILYKFSKRCIMTMNECSCFDFNF